MNELNKLSLLIKISALMLVILLSRFCPFNAKSPEKTLPKLKKKSILYRNYPS